MKKICVLFLLLCAFQTSISAQQKTAQRSAFQLSFFPPLGTHGTQAGQYTNAVSFNILAGISYNETAFTFGGLANIIKNNAAGFQFAGLLNYAGNEGKGMMFSGLANIVRYDYKGVQFGGLFNTAGDVSGLQFSGLGNIAGNVSGMQFGGLGNLAENVVGVQFGGLFNKAEDVSGVQFAGLGNVSGDVNGVQFGGLLNVARDVSGVQFAGLVNIARSSDLPIAVVNIIRNGEYGVGITYNDLGSAMATLRSGGRITYGIIGAGYNHRSEGNGLAFEAGFGAHINIVEWFRINNELKCGSVDISSDRSTFYAGYALLPAFRIHRSLEIFAGPAINFMQTDDPANAGMFPNHSLWKKQTDSRIQQLSIGYQVGIQVIL